MDVHPPYGLRYLVKWYQLPDLNHFGISCHFYLASEKERKKNGKRMKKASFKTSTLIVNICVDGWQILQRIPPSTFKYQVPKKRCALCVFWVPVCKFRFWLLRLLGLGQTSNTFHTSCGWTNATTGSEWFHNAARSTSQATIFIMLDFLLMLHTGTFKPQYYYVAPPRYDNGVVPHNNTSQLWELEAGIAVQGHDQGVFQCYAVSISKKWMVQTCLKQKYLIISDL